MTFPTLIQSEVLALNTAFAAASPLSNAPTATRTALGTQAVQLTNDIEAAIDTEGMSLDDPFGPDEDGDGDDIFGSGGGFIVGGFAIGISPIGGGAIGGSTIVISQTGRTVMPSDLVAGVLDLLDDAVTTSALVDLRGVAGRIAANLLSTG